MKFKSHVLEAFIFLYISGILDFVNCDEFDFEIIASIKDVHKGVPASNIPVTLYKLITITHGDEWIVIDKGITGNTGVVPKFYSNVTMFTAATYKLKFNVKDYYKSAGVKTFFPFVEVTFFVENPSVDTVIVVLMDAFGYTTYRGV